MELPKALKDFVRKNMTELGASSFTMYVQDPWFPGEPRLIFMHGVKYPELMYGFLFPSAARKAVLDGPAISVVSKATRKQSEQAEQVSALDRLIGQNKLYGGFATREGVVTSIRLIKRNRGNASIVLFLNFHHDRAISAPLRARLREFMKELSLVFLPTITFVVEREDPLALKNVLRILQSAEEHLDVSVEGNLKRILGWAKEIVKPAGRGLAGSVHAFDAETRTLKLVGVEGEIPLDRILAWKDLKIDYGGALLSLVAVRRAEILIPDLQKSAFKQIENCVMTNVRSVLMVPVLATGDRLVGVLNIESPTINAFSPQCLRAIWCIANLGAAVYRPAEMMQELLHIASDTQERLKLRRPLDDLAALMKRHQRAAMCFIWGVDPLKGFIALGTSNPNLEEHALPRAKGEGWSHYVLKYCQPVLISRADVGEGFSAEVWEPETDSWQIQNKTEMPDTLHELVLQHEIRQQLGMPIMDQKRCLGVLWLKYNQLGLAPRTKNAMASLFGFAGEIAMVLVSLYGKQELRLKSANEGMKTLIRSLQHDVVGQISSRIYRELCEISENLTAVNRLVPSARIESWKWLLDTQRQMMSHLRSVAEVLTGTIRPARLNFPLAEVVDKAITLVELIQKAPPCRNRVKPSLEMNADPILILLVLVNLIRNAKKFTPHEKKSEEVLITAGESSGPQAGIWVCVEDGGSGFPEHLLERVFLEHGPGVVAEHAAAGSGTGLFLCSQFVRAHGGEIFKPEQNGRGGSTLRFIIHAE